MRDSRPPITPLTLSSQGTSQSNPKAGFYCDVTWRGKKEVDQAIERVNWPTVIFYDDRKRGAAESGGGHRTLHESHYVFLATICTGLSGWC